MPMRLTILKSARPRRPPSWAVFIWVKPKRALWFSHRFVETSSFQWPVTAKYASWFSACHASHVSETSPVLLSYIFVPVNNDIKRVLIGLTLMWLRRFVRFFLKSWMIWARVACRVGSLTPRVARAAISIIFLKDGCSSAWIGYVVNPQTIKRIKIVLSTHLMSLNQPLDSSIAE